ncbi:MAG: CCA tRNA nucleotidyltransferase, partial [bacterium]
MSKTLQTATQIITQLKSAGHEAYLVGGCVRDLLMNIKPKDYDIVTSATPDEIEKILPKTVPVGRQFGVMLAIVGKETFEIATFRSDSPISDGRRPTEVFFASAKEDALRRDFTINGLFYDPITKQVLDYVNGQQDIKAHIIRFIGDPEQRLHEDYLRLLRAIRFKINLGFRYAEGVKEPIQRHAHRILKVSSERIRSELNKILTTKHRARGIDELSQTGLLHYILPELEQCKHVTQPYEFHQEGDVYTHILLALDSLPASTPLYIIWAVLLHDIGKPATFSQENNRIHFNGHTEKSVQLADTILRRLAFSNQERQKILWLISHHMHLGVIPEMRRVKQHTLLTHPLF